MGVSTVAIDHGVLNTVTGEGCFDSNCANVSFCVHAQWGVT